MICDIFPQKYHVEYKNECAKSPDDFVLSFNGREYLLKKDENGVYDFPTLADYPADIETEYLFAVDETEYYFALSDSFPDGDAFEWVTTQFFRDKLMEKSLRFVGLTASHFLRWYRVNRFCSSCGTKMERDTKERMLFCPECKNIVYPRIDPCIILAIYDGDRILLTRYANRVRANFALIAGYVETGETFEQAAVREAMEEVGVKIKNLRYYRSEPWGMSMTLLAGFYAELDGDDTITVQEDELSEGVWVHRDDMTTTFDDFSLTNDMMWHFKVGDFKDLLSSGGQYSFKK